MKVALLSERLQAYLTQHEAQPMSPTIIPGTLEVVGDFLYGLAVPQAWRLQDIQRTAEAFVFRWMSHTTQAMCPGCHQVSQQRTHTYLIRTIQDLPLTGLTVYHIIKENRYACGNPACNAATFVEQFEEYADPDARLSHRLKDFLVRQALETSANALAQSVRALGIRVSRPTVLRLVKSQGAAVVAQNLARDDVWVLGVDDINLRKGNASTACSVFLDAQTHRVLVVVQGATEAITQKVIRKYPSVEMVSRDRGTAYAAAARACGLPQVADGFHLVQNLHQAIRDALHQELGADVFLRSGEGWIRGVNAASEDPGTDATAEEPSEPLIVVGPAHRSVADREQRIHLAGLTPRQAQKYRHTLAILELSESGLRRPEIAKRLGLTPRDVAYYRKQAPETIDTVERKIDAYYAMRDQGQWVQHQKTLAPRARPAAQSIVHPYHDTVWRMFQAGHNHRDIHPVIVQEGFTGSANAVYQYLLKFCYEQGIPFGREQHVIPPDERTAPAPPRPPQIAVDRVSTTTVYEHLLHEAARQREALRQALTGPEPESPEASDSSDSPEDPLWVNRTQYSKAVADIVFDTQPKATSTAKKKLDDAAWRRLAQVVPSFAPLLACLVAFYAVLLHGEVARLDRFLAEYQAAAFEPVAIFVAGLKKDYAAVMNGLLYPNISQGPLEGTNHKIKMIRRRSYGRAGLELLNALLVLPWHYRDQDLQSAPARSDAAA
ncbi:MAG: ISL3 family transposase [Thermaerobacter sp.]|nr:ISL3 family transposase [Thermaerobacter sp.]